jgi:ketosteroid isomerase-like protein
MNSSGDFSVWKRVVVPLAVCLFSLWATPQDRTGRDAESRLLAVENVWNQAEAKGDTKALSMIFDDDLIYVDENGQLLTKSEFLAKAKSQSAYPQLLTTQAMSAQVYGDTAVVTGTYRIEQTKGKKRVQREGRFTDTWVRTHGTWVCVAAQSTPILR